jgi:hypothetical protein
MRGRESWRKKERKERRRELRRVGLFPLAQSRPVRRKGEEGLGSLAQPSHEREIKERETKLERGREGRFRRRGRAAVAFPANPQLKLR